MPKKTEAQMNSELADWVDDYFNQNEVMISLSKIKKPEQLTARARIDEIKYRTRPLEETRPSKKAKVIEITNNPKIEETARKKSNDSEGNVKNPSEKENQVLRCKNYMGYLKMKSRDQKIPEECIVCPHSIECMIGRDW